MSDCVFCKIRDGQIPAQLVMRDDRCIAFEDINPQAPVHVLFVPLQHIPSNSALTPEDRELVGHLVLAAARIATERGIAESGYRLVMNSGSRRLPARLSPSPAPHRRAAAQGPDGLARRSRKMSLLCIR